MVSMPRLTKASVRLAPSATRERCFVRGQVAINAQGLRVTEGGISRARMGAVIATMAEPSTREKIISNGAMLWEVGSRSATSKMMEHRFAGRMALQALTIALRIDCSGVTRRTRHATITATAPAATAAVASPGCNRMATASQTSHAQPKTCIVLKAFTLSLHAMRAGHRLSLRDPRVDGAQGWG
jgi:hypothetical protein